jgi:hypothetical protein
MVNEGGTDMRNLLIEWQNLEALQAIRGRMMFTSLNVLLAVICVLLIVGLAHMLMGDYPEWLLKIGRYVACMGRGINSAFNKMNRMSSVK